MPNKRRKRDNPTVVGITPERAQHGDVIEIEETTKAGTRPARNRTQTMLDRYLQRRELTLEQCDMGWCIFGLWRASECSPLRASSYEVSVSGSGIMTDEQAGARARLSGIFAKVEAPDRELLVHVCICDLPAGPELGRLRGVLNRLTGGS